MLSGLWRKENQRLLLVLIWDNHTLCPLCRCIAIAASQELWISIWNSTGLLTANGLRIRSSFAGGYFSPGVRRRQQRGQHPQHLLMWELRFFFCPCVKVDVVSLICLVIIFPSISYVTKLYLPERDLQRDTCPMKAWAVATIQTSIQGLLVVISAQAELAHFETFISYFLNLEKL